MKQALSAIAIAALLAGCTSYQHTRISYNPKTKELDLASDRDVTIGKADVLESNGVVSIHLENYSAKNNVEAIQAVVEGNAKARQDIEANGAQIVGKIIGAMK